MSTSSQLITCMFCSDVDVPRSKEDVVPHWLAEKMAYYAREALGDQNAKPIYVNFTYESPEKLLEDQSDNQIGANATGRKVIGQKPVAYKLLNVCKKCNGGWMEHLEDAARRLIPGLIEGQTKTIDPYDQLVLSMWIMKTCIAYDAVQEESFIPNDLGSRRIYMNGFPLLYTNVQIGHIPEVNLDGEILHGRDTRRLTTNPDCPAVSVGMRFGHFEIFVSFNMPTTEALASGRMIDGTGLAENDYHVEIWPPKNGRIEWPSEASKQVKTATDVGAEIRSARFKSQT